MNQVPSTGLRSVFLSVALAVLAAVPAAAQQKPNIVSIASNR